MPVNTTCDVEEKRLKRRLCGHCGKEDYRKGREQKKKKGRRREERSGHGGRDHDLTISGRRTHYG